MLFWCSFLDPHLITHHLNIGNRSRKVTELGTFTLLVLVGELEFFWVEWHEGFKCQCEKMSVSVIDMHGVLPLFLYLRAPPPPGLRGDRWLVTDEPVEVRDFRRITDHWRMYLK